WPGRGTGIEPCAGAAGMPRSRTLTHGRPPAAVWVVRAIHPPSPRLLRARPSRSLPLPLLPPARQRNGDGLRAQHARRGVVAVRLPHLAFELDDLIPQQLSPLEVEPLRGLQHLLVELLDVLN